MFYTVAQYLRQDYTCNHLSIKCLHALITGPPPSWFHCSIPSRNRFIRLNWNRFKFGEWNMLLEVVVFVAQSTIASWFVGPMSGNHRYHTFYNLCWSVFFSSVMQTMNFDVSSSSPSSTDGDHRVEDGARADRRTATSTQPTDADETAPTATDWCAWCGRGPSGGDGDLDVDEAWPSSSADGDDDDRPSRTPAYDQLRFCSRSCLSRYKMNLFCRETQRYLQQLQVCDIDTRWRINRVEHAYLI